MRQVSFRKALKLFGAEDIKLVKSKGDCLEVSGFLTGTGLNPAPFIFSKPLFEAGRTYYVSYDSSASCNGKRVMFRTAEHRKDFTGGINQWGFEDNLECLGYCL